jgi:gliding motility-associated-like protein
MNKVFTLIVPILIATGLQAQSVLISDGTASACNGALIDSGGEGGPGYGNNENHTLVLCPDQPDGAISLQWAIFDLATTGTAPIDQLSIYDGDSTSDPLIGTFTGSANPGVISASFANATGCLTLVFTSNDAGTGAFAASITCYEPCEPPTAIASVQGETVPILACQGEVLTFDASASYAAQGFSVAGYTWYWDDGTSDFISGAVALKQFNEPGEYVVQVEVQDDNGCINTNLVDLQVLVSTTPDFSGITPSQTICEGSTLLLDGTPTQPVTWSALPENNLGGSIALPDLQGVPFSSTIEFTQFEPGQILNDGNQLESVCVSMEHTFIGDLVISLACPNGQTVTFHQQEGGGTFVGDANDADDVDPIIGTCWDYCWSPTATLGTWAAESNTNTMPTTQGTALIPGTYSSVEPFSQLQGCPLNGTWTFTIVDLWGIDNGFLCDWELNFDPSLFPGLTEFTPDLGLEYADSAYWEGPDISDPGPATSILTATTPGDYDYTFYVVDNFGCTYDTTITITVVPFNNDPIAISGPTTICTGATAQLSAPAGYTSYVWSNGATGQTITVGAGTYSVTVDASVCNFVSAQHTVTEVPQPQPVITGPPFACGGALAELTTTEPFDNYTWSNGATTDSITVGTGSYTVTVTNDGCVGTSAPFQVQVGSDPQAAFATDPTSPQPIGAVVDMINNSSGNGASITDNDWSVSNGLFTSSEFEPTFTFIDPGTYPITLIVTASDGCTDTLTINFVIQPQDIEVPNVFTPNNDGINDALVFENVQYYSNHLVVYNRWGQIVHETNNYRNNWRATDVPDGTYYFILNLENGKEYAGHVTILR